MKLTSGVQVYGGDGPGLARVLASARNGAMCLLLTHLLATMSFATSPDISLAGDFGEPRIIVAAPKDSSLAHLAWPKVVGTRTGTLVTAYVAGRFHGTHGGGCPSVSYSTDGGHTFSPPHVLKKYGPNETYTSAGNVALGLADDGAIVLLSMAYNGDQANTIDGWRSPDNGKNWQPVDVSRLANNKTGSVYGHVFSVPGKGLAVVGHYRKSPQQQTTGLWLSYSADGGRTWGDPQTITTKPLVEPAFVFAGNRFVGLSRVANTPAYYTQLTSEDLGRTWQVVPKVLAPAKPRGVRYPSPGIFVDPRNPQQLLALASQRFSPVADNGLYGQIDLFAAHRKTLAWERIGILAKFPQTLGDRKDLTYGWMTPLTGRKWFAVFYCGRTMGPSDIYGLEFAIPEKKE